MRDSGRRHLADHRYVAPGIIDPAWHVLGSAAAIIVVQALFSYYWLRWFRYGPIEGIWRCLTSWQLVPNRCTRDERRQRAGMVGVPQRW
ncbi:DUF418 domain-containing protein [Nocardia sp. NBC_01009]|uniref:DUF418 domain-containing protein n=1 Tax=Nocardia sp. NBC_01009 TaxID=2975996 RepID=UPI00386FC6D7|nr:DUF418 domain-containing protein [Nocardia sp. NBC_01009]